VHRCDANQADRLDRSECLLVPETLVWRKIFNWDIQGAISGLGEVSIIDSMKGV
jgi:hypothetical protein